MHEEQIANLPAEKALLYANGSGGREAVLSKSRLEHGIMSNNELLTNLDRLHTTELGVARIKRNLSLDTDDVAGWCKIKISSPNALIQRNGKNWYVTIDGCIITINAYSFTIITAHREKK